ncbi:hypothetical protein LIER_13276 [Lithospermum erythrorhizon]|uniref:Uncharacterized protein n=1 Tax=Lithospermum erythrorhizon TaxID=34254 RepID=A0AAV3Q032_LITER
MPITERYLSNLQLREDQVTSAAGYVPVGGVEATNLTRSSHHQHPPRHIPVQAIVKYFELRILNEKPNFKNPLEDLNGSDGNYGLSSISDAKKQKIVEIVNATSFLRSKKSRTSTADLVDSDYEESYRMNLPKRLKSDLTISFYNNLNRVDYGTTYDNEISYEGSCNSFYIMGFLLDSTSDALVLHVNLPGGFIFKMGAEFLQVKMNKTTEFFCCVGINLILQIFDPDGKEVNPRSFGQMELSSNTIPSSMNDLKTNSFIT